MSTEENIVNYKAIAWTVGIHALILLLFFFLSYSVPATQPVVEMGMEVNIGTSADGFGTNQPLVAGEPAPNESSVTYSSTAPKSSLPANMLESTDEDAPVVNQVNKRNKNNRNDNTRPTNSNTTRNNSNNTADNNRTRQQKPRYVYDGGAGTGGNGSANDAAGGSEGNTSGDGDRGVPGGTPGAGNYEGTPGSGISHTLGGRSIVAFPDRDADFKEGGKVVVRITVNRQGQIINKRIESASNSGLRSIALKKVDKIRFNKSETSPEEQFGKITFVFKTRS